TASSWMPPSSRRRRSRSLRETRRRTPLRPRRECRRRAGRSSTRRRFAAARPWRTRAGRRARRSRAASRMRTRRIDRAGSCHLLHDGRELIRFAGGPGLAEEAPVHAREVAVALAELAAEEGHALDDAGVREAAGVDVAER